MNALERSEQGIERLIINGLSDRLIEAKVQQYRCTQLTFNLTGTEVRLKHTSTNKPFSYTVVPFARLLLASYTECTKLTLYISNHITGL